MPWREKVKQEVLEKAKETLEKVVRFKGHPEDEYSAEGRQVLEFAKPMHDINSMLAREITQMSIDEREHVYEELHGVEHVREETPDFVNQSLQKMGEALHAIPEAQKKAYTVAQERNPSFVQDTKYRLKFLRAAAYDPSKAAERMIAWLANKLKYFGPEVLSRPLHLSDLGRSDLRTLRSGMIQVLPSRDRAGRVVIYRTMPSEAVWVHPENAIKAFAYILSAVSEDDENQIHGVVYVGFQMGNQVLRNREMFDVVQGKSELVACAPVRLAGVHVRYEDPLMNVLTSIFLSTIGRDLRVHYRLHEGTHQEALYSLLSFGLPVETMPHTSEGTLKLREHCKWVARRKIKEQILGRGEYFVRIDLPKRTDILCGKGRPVQQHHGNVMMREVIESRIAEYQAMQRNQKVTLSVSMFDQLSKSGVRFLKRDDDGWWSEVTQEEACQKIMKTFVSTAAAAKKRKDQHLHTHSLLDSNVSKRARLFESEEDSCFSSGCGWSQREANSL